MPRCDMLPRPFREVTCFQDVTIADQSFVVSCDADYCRAGLDGTETHHRDLEGDHWMRVPNISGVVVIATRESGDCLQGGDFR